MEGNLRFKLDRASLIVGSKFTIFSLFYIVFEGKLFSKYKPLGVLYLEGRFNGGFLRYRFGGLIFGRDYTWRGLFSEFCGKTTKLVNTSDKLIKVEEMNNKN